MSTPQSAAALDCVIAQNTEDRNDVYRLRYACYRRDGSIPPNPDEMFVDRFDTGTNNFSFLVRGGTENLLPRRPLATLRISVVKPEMGWLESPAQMVYGDHRALLAMASESYVEASRLCFAEQARRDSFVRLVGHMAAMADFYDVKWLVACPRVEHAATYERMFGFVPLAEPRKYYGVGFETQLLAIARADLRLFVRNAKPLTAAWSDALTKLVGAARMPVPGAVAC